MAKKKKMKNVPFPEFMRLEEIEYEDLAPERVIELIDLNFFKFSSYMKLKGENDVENSELERLYIDFGIMSREMNTVMRRRMKEEPKNVKLRIAYAYWWNRYQYLETYRKRHMKFIHRGTTKKGRRWLKKLMKEADLKTPEELRQQYKAWMNIVDRFSTQKEE